MFKTDKINLLVVTTVSVATSLMLVACSGYGEIEDDIKDKWNLEENKVEQTTSEVETRSGILIPSYSNATVFEDLNDNFAYDIGEQLTRTSDDGNWTLEINKSKRGNILAFVPNGASYSYIETNGTVLSKINDKDYYLIGFNDSKIISPYSTICPIPCYNYLNALSDALSDDKIQYFKDLLKRERLTNSVLQFNSKLSN